MANPLLDRFNRAISRLGDVVSTSDPDQLLFKSESRAAGIAGIKGWLVTRVGDNVFTCTCPDYLGQVILGNDLNNVKADFGRTFYPCKHIIGVSIVTGSDYVDLVTGNPNFPEFGNTFDDTFDETFSKIINVVVFDNTFDSTFGSRGVSLLAIFDDTFDKIFD